MKALPLLQLTLFARFCAAASAGLLLGHSVQATPLYWDTDGTGSAGAGATPEGTWGTSIFWNTSSTGTGGTLTATTTSSDDLFFSAGSDAGITAVMVAASSTLSANKITVEEGTVTISGNAATSFISLGSGGLTLQSTAAGALTLGSSSTAAANTPITIAAAQTWTNNHATAPITIRSPLTITNLLTIEGVSTGGINLLGANTGSGGVRINGATVAVNRSISTSFGTGTLRLSSGDLRPSTGGSATISNALQIDGNFIFKPTGSNDGNLIFTGGGTISNAPTLTLTSKTTPGTQFTTGAITLNSDVTFDGAGLGLISSSISEDATPRRMTYSGSGTLTLSGSNSFSGDTTINSGTLSAAATNALDGTSGITVNSGGTLLLGGAGNDRINNGATLNLAGGTFNLGGKSEGAVGTTGLGALTLTANSVIDFGLATNENNVIQFSGVGTHTAGTILAITNWNGAPAVGGGSERLLFAGMLGQSTSFDTLFGQSEVSFNGIGGYTAVGFDGYYEITAVPEPSTILGALILIGLIGYRDRRRLSHTIAARDA